MFTRAPLSTVHPLVRIRLHGLSTHGPCRHAVAAADGYRADALRSDLLFPAATTRLHAAGEVHLERAAPRFRAPAAIDVHSRTRRGDAMGIRVRPHPHDDLRCPRTDD